MKRFAICMLCIFLLSGCVEKKEVIIEDYETEVIEEIDQEIDVVEEIEQKIDVTKFGVPFGHISKEKEIIEIGNIVVKIDPDVYIPDDLGSKLEIVFKTMEDVSGLSFKRNENYVNRYSDKYQLEVKKPAAYELGPCYSGVETAEVCSGDLVEWYAMIHEMSHGLQYLYSPYEYCQWAMEGISTYTTHKTVDRLIKTHPELISFMPSFQQDKLNYELYDYSKLYEHDMGYWAKNTLSPDNSCNANYPIGYYLMTYLDETFGDYTSWIKVYEEEKPAYERADLAVPIKYQIELFEDVYGESVFEDFYDWLKENSNRFLFGYETFDMKNLRSISVYPSFYYATTIYQMRIICDHSSIEYKDLVIYLDEGKDYMSIYKGLNVDDLKLFIDDYVTVELYDSEGQYLETLVSVYDQPIDLKDVSYIKLTGEGVLNKFEITNFE